MSNNSSSMGKMIARVVFIIVCILLIINFARKLYSGADLSFTAFLNWLGNIDSFNVSFGLSPWHIGGDWGIVDGLRKFFNQFGNVLGVIFFMFANLLNSLYFVFQFLRFILG